MSIFAGPNIVKDSLAMYIDAGNSDSYPGSGTTWYDLSGNGLNADLTVAPTYDSNGYFVFDGVDDYATAASGLQTVISSATEFTVFAWANVTYIAHVSNIIGWGDANTGKTWGIYSYSGTLRNMYNYATDATFGNVATLGNRWVFFSARGTRTTTKTDTLGGYVLNRPTYTLSGGLEWWTANAAYPIKMGKISYSNSTSYMCGMSLGSIMVYDRYLSDDEMKQTYAATRGRYGF